MKLNGSSIFNRAGQGLAFSLVLLLAACSEPESAKVDNLQLARFYADNGTYSLALSTLGQEQQKAPNNPAVYRQLAQIYLELGYAVDALEAIDKAIQLGCKDADCQELRLRSLIAAGRVDEAEKLLGQAGDRLSPDRRGLYRARIDLRRSGDRARALTSLKSIDLPEARSDELKLLFAEKDYPRILEIYQKRKGKEVNAGDWLIFAKTLYLMKQYEEADRVLIQQRLADNSDVITPRKIEAVELQVKNNIAQNKFAEAQAIYDAFLENYKGSGYVAMQEALKDLKSRDFDSAIKNIESLAQAAPDNLQTALILSLAKFGKGDFQSVVDKLSLFRDKLDPRGRNLLAKAYLNLRQPDPVIELLGKPSEPELQLDLASAWLLKGDRKRARQLIDAVDPKPLGASELLQYAQLLGQLGEEDRLIKLLSNRKLEDPRLQRMLVGTLIRKGRGDEAEAYARSLNNPRQSLELQVLVAVQNRQPEKALALQQQLTRDRQDKADEAKLAALYLANKKPEQGFEAIQRGFDKPGDNTAFLKMLRRLLQKEEITGLREWMQARPKTVNGYRELQLLLAESELETRPDQARQRLEPLMEENDPRAVVLMAKADPDHAVKILQDALDRSYQPLIAQLLYQYYQQKGDKKSFASLLDRMEVQQKDSPQKDALLARGYLRLGDPVRAQTFAEALDEKGRKAEALEILGDIALAGKQYPEAVRKYGAALSARPDDRLAAKYYQARLVAGEKSEKVFSDAAELLNRHPDFLAVKGLVAGSLLQTRPEQARKLYRDILERQPRNVTAMNNLAWLNLEQDPSRALELSKKAFRMAPRNLNVADTYIRSLNRVGERDKARQLLERLLENNPDSRILKQLSETMS